MKKRIDKKDRKVGKFVYWTPRVLSIIFICFLALMSLDVFDSASSFSEILIGLFMHNIPVFILVAVLIIAWKYEWVGGIAFILGGIAYIISILITIYKNKFEWYYLAWIIQISGVAFLIGILFFVNWFKKKK